MPLIFYCLSDSLPASVKAAGDQGHTRRLDPRLFRAIEFCCAATIKLASGSPRARDWFRALIQNIDVAPIDEEPVPLLSRSLADDSELLHVLDCLGNGRR